MSLFQNSGNNQSSNNFSSQGGGLFKSAPQGNASYQQNSSSSLFNNLVSNNSGSAVFASSASSSTPVGQTRSGGSLFSGSTIFAGSASAFSNTPSGQANNGVGLFSNQKIQNPIVPADKMPSPSDAKSSLSAEEIKALFPKILTNSSSVSSKFVISNDIGKIEFEGNRDVREKDLDILSDLKQQIDLLAKGDLSTEMIQPNKRERLDKPATVTLYNCFSDTDGNKKYEIIAKKLGCEFINYDEGTRTLKIKIMHL